jgi:glycosyltransferase involved in cell wall biosynthesis
MRHGAWTLAEMARVLVARGEQFDTVVTTDMLDLPTWRAAAPAALTSLPTVVYFHENQLCYPAPTPDPRDLHFGFTNLLSAALADEAWFNSDWHRGEFYGACADLLARVPDHPPGDALERARAHTAVLYPGFALSDDKGSERASGQDGCHILWAARWEADKGPEDFFAALRTLMRRGVDFRVSAIGRSGLTEPSLFADARRELGNRVVTWGWQEERAAYERVLRAADVVASTARHEFFGIAVVEAVAAGAFPLLPERLAYPEVFADFASESLDAGTYDGTVEHLAVRLEELCARHARGDLWQGAAERGKASVAGYGWQRAARALDDRLEAVAATKRP